MDNSKNPPELNLDKIFSLLQLSKLARRSESAEALQFLLVNQTYSLSPYDIGVLWVAGEGVVMQSGVSQIERNAPFIQWLNSICTQVQAHGVMTRVTSDLANPEDIQRWSEYLPASALWLPIAGPEQSVAGLLLCRQAPWLDGDLALLDEWVDTWSHAWVKMHAPSIHGELSRVWDQIQLWLPKLHDLKKQAYDLLLGMQHVFHQGIKKPHLWPSYMFKGFRFCYGWCQSRLSTIRQTGWRATYSRIELEVEAIWDNPKRRYKWLAILILLFPMRLTVLAPAELVPLNPAIIRTPIEGVVDEFFVTPNQRVVEGQALFKLDLTTLKSRLNVAEQETQVASSEYRQSVFQSLSDAKSRSQIVPQEGKMAQRKVEADYLKDLLAKAQIKAPKSGIVLFDDPSEWVGKPVVAGEKVMVIATEGQVEIEAWVPINDAIIMPNGAPVVLYLNASPLSPVDGVMKYIGHEALPRPDGSYAYRLRARLSSGEQGSRVGLKGTAKISGQYVPFIYLVMRKPLSAIRQFMGI